MKQRYSLYISLSLLKLQWSSRRKHTLWSSHDARCFPQHQLPSDDDQREPDERSDFSRRERERGRKRGRKRETMATDSPAERRVDPWERERAPTAAKTSTRRLGELCGDSRQFHHLPWHWHSSAAVNWGKLCRHRHTEAAHFDRDHSAIIQPVPSLRPVPQRPLSSFQRTSSHSAQCSVFGGSPISELWQRSTRTKENCRKCTCFRFRFLPASFYKNKNAELVNLLI